METKQSKVKSVQANGTFESQYGLLYKFEYQMEDGTVLTANHKGQTPLPAGTDVEYEIKGSNDHGSYGKVSKPKPANGFQKGGSYGGSKSNNASFALSYAKDLGIANIEKGVDVSTENILTVATKFKEWLDNNG